MHLIKSGLSLLLLLVLIVVLNTKIGSIPPLGKFFDPDAGFWANAETTAPESEELNLEGTRDKVSVFYDERRVPHIFAENDYDLYYTQGYITAKDRLFQMEVQTYDASGRLAEIIGPDLLERDLETRRLGMPYGADKALEAMKNDPEAMSLVQAYANGVNAYISSLSADEYPIEYKILDFKPEEWTPLKTAHLLKAMTKTLAGRNDDMRMSNTLKYFGEDFVETFFNISPKLTDPIIPATRVWDFKAIPVQKPDSLFVPTSTQDLGEFERPEGIGSNNWAVSGSKTESGFPILANDPHLSLTLPSIWYEVQLHAPGINTYGVSLQGVPGVIIGFNEHVAWGVTNVASDVMDWYEVKFKDSSKREYWHDGKWKPTTTRIEEIKIRGQETLLDTVFYTHHGPVTEKYSRVNPESEPSYYALRWIAHEPSTDVNTFYGLNRAKNYDDYVEALSHYVAPAQNFVFASNEGDIALWVNGKFPNKWKYQGRTVSDGTDPLYDWQGWIPHEHNPHVKNPKRGFVSSANQPSVAPSYPYYMGDDYAPFERGRRINDRLREMENITAQDMQHLQLDNYSYHAATILPEMLGWIDRDGLSESELEKLKLVEEWNYFNDAEKLAPSIFRVWWSKLYDNILDDEFESTKASLRYPARDRLTEILKYDAGFEFIDDINTEKVETLNELVTTSFNQTLSTMRTVLGDGTEEWQWGYYAENDIDHLASIPGFGRERVFTGGGRESVNATRGGNGPSWRMIVELGPEVKGYGVYPGGASGNPGSPDYDSMVETWRTGGFFELKFMKEKPTNYLYKIEIN
ncbi:MAG: penicillin acylase family protein [Balneolaceae bacterium]